MTDEQLAEIERVWARATAKHSTPLESLRLLDEGGVEIVFGEAWLRNEQATMVDRHHAITMAADHVAALVAEVKRLRAEVERLETQNDSMDNELRRIGE